MGMVRRGMPPGDQVQIGSISRNNAVEMEHAGAVCVLLPGRYFFYLVFELSLLRINCATLSWIAFSEASWA